MRPVRLMTLAVLAVLVMSVGLQAGIYFEQELKMPAQPGMPASVVNQVVYISGAKMRIESVAMGMKSVGIQRLDLGKTYNLIPAQKLYMEMPIPKPPAQPAGQEPAVTVSKTQETKKIGKYTCTRCDVTVGGETLKFWITEDVDLGGELTDYWKATSQDQPPKMAQEMSKVKGFPIRMEMPSPQGPIVGTVTTVKKQDIPDSMFEVPEGYQKMSMPGGAP
ncbi:MAG: DUF4412 domain-containing protein [Planctomycetes bacterium]|nr:DUF4412 domain-containing protein [Planctomycetota bacterium]